jgi:4-hydroxy-3-methylbut-2-enyl diphosphate reductase
MLVQRAAEIDWQWFAGISVLGLSAGASAPDVLIDEVIEAAKARFNVRVEEVRIVEENVTFKVPGVLTAAE